MDKNDAENMSNGYILNLLDVYDFDECTAQKIRKQELTYSDLTEDQRQKYPHFFLETDADMVFAEDSIESPYIELVLQRFSSAFSKIGIDVDTDTVKGYWKNRSLT